MALVKNLKVGISVLETTPGGTTGAIDCLIPIRGLPSFDRKAEKALDPAIVGNRMDVGEYTVAQDVKGSLPVSWRACKGASRLIRAGLTASTGYVIAQVGGCVRIKYSGSAASCKIMASSSDGKLKAYVGAKGSEAGDTAFGTAGVLSTTAAANNTIGEIVTVVDAYANYTAKKLFGNSSQSSTGIIAIATAQAKNKSVYVFFKSSGSGAYAHFLPADLSDAELPTFGLQTEGIHTRHRWYGASVAGYNVSAALKGFAEGDVELLGMTEKSTEPAATTSILGTEWPMIFSQGQMDLDGSTWTFVRNMNLQLANNPNAEGFGQGSVLRQYHQKGHFSFAVDAQFRGDTSIDAYRAKQFDGSEVGFSAFFKGNTIGASVPEGMLWDAPFCAVSNYEPVENGDVLDSKLTLKALNPAGTTYQHPVRCVIISNDTGRY